MNNQLYTAVLGLFLLLISKTLPAQPCNPPIPPTVLPPITICSSDLPFFLPWGDVVMGSGNYIGTLVSASGCDSIVVQTITVKPPIISNFSAVEVCGNDCFVTCDGAYCTPGSYTLVCTSWMGCDSTIQLTTVPFNSTQRGVVYRDNNANGTRDYLPVENVLSGVTLRSSTGEVVTSDNNGRFLFNSLAAGDTIFVDDPGVSSAGSLPAFHIYDPQSTSCYDFGILPVNGTALGKVFYDLDENGVFNNPPDLLAKNTTVSVTGKPNQQTNISGEFSFSNVSNGSIITTTPTVSYTAISPPSYTYDENVVYGYDFGILVDSGAVQGTVFWDYNGNGVFDFGEPRAPGITVFTSSGAVVSTDVNGVFNFGTLPLGDTLRAVPPGPMGTVAPDFLTTTFSNTDNYHFGVLPPPGAFDLAVTLQPAGVFRPGFSTSIVARVVNNIDPVSNVRMKVVLPAWLNVGSFSVPPDQTIGDTLVWVYGGLGPAETQTVSIQVTVPVGTALGTPVECRAYVEPTLNDNVLSNNAYLLSREVVGSYDPNDKLSNPAYVLSSEAEQRNPIEYTVRFQNTGTFPADFVVIRDTLSEQLDLSSFRFLSSSHPCTWKILPGRILVVDFQNINLPDSTSNEPESHGFAHFSLRPAEGFALGDLISNRASIYFDYNDPIHTNEASTQVVYFIPGGPFPNETLALSVRPNPVSWTLYLSWNPPAEDQGRIRMFNMQGLPALVENVDPGMNRAELDVSYLPDGIYFIILELPGYMQQRKVVVAHEGPVRRQSKY